MNEIYTKHLCILHKNTCNILIRKYKYFIEKWGRGWEQKKQEPIIRWDREQICTGKMNSKAHIKITKCYFSFINQVQHTHKRAITQPRERDIELGKERPLRTGVDLQCLQRLKCEWILMQPFLKHTRWKGLCTHTCVQEAPDSKTVRTVRKLAVRLQEKSGARHAPERGWELSAARRAAADQGVLVLRGTHPWGHGCSCVPRAGGELDPLLRSLRTTRTQAPASPKPVEQDFAVGFMWPSPLAATLRWWQGYQTALLFLVFFCISA